MISLRRLVFLASGLVVTALGLSVLTAQQFSASLYGDLRWRCIGPFRAGRTASVAGVPSQPNVFYIAAVNGGVWKTIDYGETWQPIFDAQPTGSVGAMAVAPSDRNIIYVGSGEGMRRPDLSTGDGIYKSTDAGDTWQHLGLRDGQQIGAIGVDPHDPNRVFVAVLGHPYSPNSERGVFRSDNGGETWQRVLYKDDNTGATALVLDPSNAQIIYASLWTSRRPPWTTSDALEAPGSGLYKSTDGGTTWRELTRGLPTAADGLGRIVIDVASSKSSRVYAVVKARQLSGVYRSDDAGESWQRTNSEARLLGRTDLISIHVDPKEENKVYVTNTSTYRSTDGGRAFTAIKGAPGGDDYINMWISPDNPDIILLGSDQGATLSVNGGKTWSSWYNQPTAQFYHVITDNRFPYWVYGGQQESGSAGTASRSDYGEISFRDWHPIGAEEYGYIAPDPLDPNIIYGGKVTRFNQSTGEVQEVGPVVVRTSKYRFNRTAPLIFSPVDPRILYLGSNVLFKTTNGGHSWQIISPDLTRENPGAPPNLGVFAEHDPAQGKHRGVIYTLAPSPRDGNLIWVGTDDGLVQVTRDGGKTWHNVTPPELTPWSKLAMIDASHFDTATAYAAVNRFRLDDLHPHIYRTHDGGKTWHAITRYLPNNEPVNVVREDPARKGLLFAGTERSVYVSFNDGDDWQSLRLNLPATSIRDLVVHGDDVVVGTHGRSFWILDNITPLRQITSEVAAGDAYLFRPQIAYRIHRNKNTDTPLPPEVPAGKNPPDGAIVDYYSHLAASGPVTLEVFDTAGKLVRRFSSTDKPEVTEPELQKELQVPTYWVRPPAILSAAAGMHRFVWDLHYPPPDSLHHDYPISAVYRDTPRYPLGPAVLPGQYTVKLTVNGHSYARPLIVKMDPRVKTPTSGLEQQFRLAAQVTAAMHSDYQTLEEVRKLRADLKKLAERAGQGPLAEAIAVLDHKAQAIEGTSSRAAGSLVGESGEPDLSRLNGQLAQVLEVLEGADATPTAQAVAAVGEFERSLQSQLARWQELKSRDMASLNAQLRQAGLPQL